MFQTKTVYAFVVFNGANLKDNESRKYGKYNVKMKYRYATKKLSM
jgi:hypothetical protein